MALWFNGSDRRLKSPFEIEHDPCTVVLLESRHFSRAWPVIMGPTHMQCKDEDLIMTRFLCHPLHKLPCECDRSIHRRQLLWGPPLSHILKPDACSLLLLSLSPSAFPFFISSSPSLSISSVSEAFNPIHGNEVGGLDCSLCPPCTCLCPPSKTDFIVQGRVYCDTCQAGFETSATTYIHGTHLFFFSNLILIPFVLDFVR